MQGDHLNRYVFKEISKQQTDTKLVMPEESFSSHTNRLLFNGGWVFFQCVSSVLPRKLSLTFFWAERNVLLFTNDKVKISLLGLGSET